jgi:5-methylcytosine-specific restriction endonuclease McrA
MAKASNWQYFPGQSWYFQRKNKLTKRDELRARDGDNCWLCGHKMRFGGIPNIGKAATIEHLRPLSKGGTSAIDNLALCHVGCNRHMRDFDRPHKEKMRAGKARARPGQQE